MQELQYDCFLAHSWEVDESGRNNHDAVSKINNALQEKGLATWFNDGGKEGYALRGIESAAVVVVFITSSYLERAARDNDPYKIVFDYALTTKSGMLVGVPMEKQLLNTESWHGHAGGTLSGKLYEAHFAFDMKRNKKEFGQQVDKLHHQILKLKDTPRQRAPAPKPRADVREVTPSSRQLQLGYEEIVNSSAKLVNLLRGKQAEIEIDLRFIST